MKSIYELAKTRRSIRKFQEHEIPQEDIEYFIQTATMAPSGCNSQCWNFVAVKNKDIINRMSEAVTSKFEEIIAGSSQITRDYIEGKKKGATFFAKAPLVIAVFMTEAVYYDQTFANFLESKGLDYESRMKFYGNYDYLSIGAAVQNLLLAVHEKSYGACWMNDPVIAGTMINEILGVPENEKLISLIPVGVPAYTPRDKRMKEFEEIYKLIE